MVVEPEVPELFPPSSQRPGLVEHWPAAAISPPVPDTKTDLFGEPQLQEIIRETRTKDVSFCILFLLLYYIVILGLQIGLSVFVEIWGLSAPDTNCE
jgi:hypothetical protein